MLRHVSAACVAFGLMLVIGFQASAADLNGGNLVPVASAPVGSPATLTPVVKAPTPGAAYSNVDNFLGNGFLNLGAAADPANPANTITKLVADDLTPISGGVVSQATFAVLNSSQDHDISARARIRFYNDNAGAPGTLITGFTFNPFTFPQNTVILLTGNLAGSGFAIPNAKFWAGITFDNNGGTTGAADTDLNLLGQGLFNPPVIGTSADVAFETNSQGAFLSDNPPGSLFNFNGNPPANFGWEFVVPEPGTLSLAGLAVMGMLVRRR